MSRFLERACWLLLLLACAMPAQAQDVLTATLTRGSSAFNIMEGNIAQVCATLSTDPGVLSPLEVVLTPLVTGGSGPGADVTPPTATIVFETGNPLTECVNFTIIDDSFLEQVEGLQVDANSSIAVIPSLIFFNILESSPPIVGFQQASYSFGETAGGGQVCVVIAEGGGIAVNAASVSLEAQMGGSAIVDEDYSLTQTNIPLPFGTNSSTPVCVSISVLDDDDLESQESFILALAGPIVNPALANTTIIIQDNEAATLSLQLDAPESAIIEGNGTDPVAVNVSVALTNLPAGGLQRTIVALVSFTLDTADSDDVEASDTTLTFPTDALEGATMQATFSILPDTLYEDDESFTITLSAISADMLGPNSSLVVTILNDDPIPDCGSLEIANGVIMFSSGTLFGSDATYTCNSTFVLQGNSERSCQANATWTGSNPQCIPVTADCGDLEIDNGEITFSIGTQFGSTATYICDSGFELEGNQQRVCQSDSTWTGSDPDCNGQGRVVGIAVGVSIGGAAFIALLLIVIIVIAFCVYRRKKSEKYVLNYSTVYGERNKVPLADTSAAKPANGGGEAEANA